MKKIEINSEGVVLCFVFENGKLGIQLSSSTNRPGCFGIVLDDIVPWAFLNALDGFREHHVMKIENSDFQLDISIDPEDQRFGDYPTLTLKMSTIQTDTTIAEGWMVCSVEKFLSSVSSLIG